MKPSPAPPTLVPRLLAPLLFVACGASPPSPTGPMDAAWGIARASAHVSAAGDKVDVRYRVRDPAKAAPVVNRQVLPTLVHGPSGTVLTLPEQRHVGGARPAVKPEPAKTYFILFENPNALVRPGDALMLRIGDAEPVALVAQ